MEITKVTIDPDRWVTLGIGGMPRTYSRCDVYIGMIPQESLHIEQGGADPSGFGVGAITFQAAEDTAEGEIAVSVYTELGPVGNLTATAAEPYKPPDGGGHEDPAKIPRINSLTPPRVQKNGSVRLNGSNLGTITRIGLWRSIGIKVVTPTLVSSDVVQFVVPGDVAGRVLIAYAYPGAEGRYVKTNLTLTVGD
jgi:hypothetical protein